MATTVRFFLNGSMTIAIHDSLMHPKNEHLPLFDAFSDICQKAYRSWHLVTSPVLAKVGLTDLFQEYAKGGDPSQLSKLFLLNKLFRYYVGGSVHFFLLVCCKVAHIFSAQRTVIPQNKTVFIDTYFVIDNFWKGDDVLAHCFPGIRQPIADAGWEHVILPRFYGHRNPFVFYRMFRALRTHETPVLTEFQILTGRDYVYLLVHMLIYPWLVVGLLKSVPRTREGLFVRAALLNGLNCGNISGAVRYFVGLRLAPLLPEKSRCLQWFENQAFDRCFNRGLREAEASMPIYGAQLFIWPPEIMNIHLDKNEAAAHKPDIVLVNGPYYKHENVDVPPCRRGASLRYARLFETSIALTGNKGTLVVLSQLEPEARFTVELVVQAELPGNLMFKPHPALQLAENHKKLIPTEGVIVEGNLYDVIGEASLVVGSASGALVEAAAMGVPVIVASQESAVKYTYLPDIGRGLLWEIASNAQQLQAAKARLQNAVSYMKDERLAAIERLRTELFTRPTSVAIEEMMGLQD